MKPKNAILMAVFGLTILIWGAYAFRCGIVMSPDSYGYSELADTLVSDNFRISAYREVMKFAPTSCLYMAFISLVAVVKLVAGALWQQAIVMINVFFGALLAVMLADLVYVFTKNKIAVCVTFILYVLNPEIILWSRYVLSDASYMFLNFLIFYFLARAFMAEGRLKAIYFVITAFVFMVNIFYRPTSIVMAPIFLFAFYLDRRKEEMRWKRFFIFFIGIVLLGVLIHAALVNNVWPLSPGKSKYTDYAVSVYQKGYIIVDRPHTYHPKPATTLDCALMTADKFTSFFYFSDKLFSLKHKIVNYLFFVPLYLLSVLGVIAVIRTYKERIKKSLVALAVITIFSYGIFHSLTVIDYDWRYRLPVLPYILFLSGLGADFLFKMLGRGRRAKI